VFRGMGGEGAGGDGFGIFELNQWFRDAEGALGRGEGTVGPRSGDDGVEVGEGGVKVDGW